MSRAMLGFTGMSYFFNFWAGLSGSCDWKEFMAIRGKTFVPPAVDSR